VILKKIKNVLGITFMKIIKIIIQLYILLLIPIYLLAQYPDWTEYNTSNSGLPGNWVFSIAIDGSGNKWITR